MKTFFMLAVGLIFSAPFLINAYQFSNCDFESDYKCEAIHGIGIIIPPASWITVWFDSDSNQ